MKGIVLYKSKYGNTKQYAQWIADDLKFEVRDLSQFKKSEIGNYEQIIFGTGVYMGKMNQLKKVLKLFKDKPITIFACAGNAGVEKEIEDIKSNNFNPEELAFHDFFYLPGGVDFSKVKGIMKLMINIFRKVLQNKKDKTYDEEQILKGFTEPSNYVEKEHIKEIVEFMHKSAK
ncbi:MAG: flavodoxin domain-containing protein [Acholeplasmataceae bacterium]|nr:flavodoxin domain-containing protein [Acholeplasmataceae bacterium]